MLAMVPPIAWPGIAMLVVAVVAGFTLGCAFYGGLWWTVRKGLTMARPAPLFAASFVLRMAFALAGLYVISAGDWRRLLACVLGFVAAKPVVRAWTREVTDATHS